MYNPLDKPVCYMGPPEKIKTGDRNSIIARSAHNFRLDDTVPLYPDRTCQNDILLDAKKYAYTTADGEPIYDDNGNVRGDYKFAQQVEDRIDSFGIQPRSNANVALEVILKITKGFDQLPENFDIEKWKKESLQWLEEKWGKENLMSVVYHADEATPHIHCILTPITPDGRLSSHDWLSRKDDCMRLSKDYFDHVKQDGLAPALSGHKMPYSNPHSQSKARAALDEAGRVEIVPERQPGESVDEYVKRVKKEVSDFSMKKQAELADETRKMFAENDRILRELEDAKEAKKKAEKDVEYYKDLAKRERKEKDTLEDHIMGSGIPRSALKNAAELKQKLTDEFEVEIRGLKISNSALTERNSELAAEAVEQAQTIEELEEENQQLRDKIALYNDVLKVSGLSPEAERDIVNMKLLRYALANGYPNAEVLKDEMIKARKFATDFKDHEHNPMQL